MLQVCKSVSVLRNLHILRNHHNAWNLAYRSYIWFMIVVSLISLISALTDLLIISVVSLMIFNTVVQPLLTVWNAWDHGTTTKWLSL